MLKSESGDGMGHTIPENVKNSELTATIDEYVRLERDRQILKDHWFGGLSFERIAEKNNCSVTCVKRVVYSIGEKILLKTTLENHKI